MSGPNRPPGSSIRRTCSGEMPVPRDAESYNMSHPNRGKCIVFNNEKFSSNNAHRIGSTVDVERIRTTFSNLGFRVFVFNDLVCSEIEEEIKELSEADYTTDDCICIFVLTHGHKSGKLAASDESYNSETICRPFTADKCPTLAGKPKLFFFQACRGNGIDASVRMDRLNHRQISNNSQPTANAGFDRTPYTIPTCADFLFAHSSVEGFSAFCDIKDGSWYIQTLCKVLDKDANRQDLVKMLMTTARNVAIEFGETVQIEDKLRHVKQVPSFTSNLTRELYFAKKTPCRTNSFSRTDCSFPRRSRIDTCCKSKRCTLLP